MRLVALRQRPPGRGGRGRPYPAETVREVRDLVEGSVLPVPEIARRTGIPRGTIHCWATRGGWQRPAGAPVATRRARRRTEETAKGAARTWRTRFLREAAWRIAAIEAAGAVDLDGLAAAVGLLRKAGAREGRGSTRPASPDASGARAAAAAPSRGRARGR